MPISAPPTIPQITDSSTFAERSQAWVVWQANDFYPGITDIAGLSGLPSSATSTTSNTIGTGSKSFTVETGRGFVAGQSLSIANTTTPTNRMFAVVTSYNSGTGALVVNVQAIEGSGTFTAWSIALAYNGLVSPAQLSTGAPAWNSSGEFTVTDPALLGYGTGAGGTVTQLTSKTTAVTLNKPCGYITTNNSTLASNASINFQLNNSLISNTDVVICNVVGNAGNHKIEAINTGVSGAVVTLRITNISAGSLGDAVVIAFAVIKGVTS